MFYVIRKALNGGEDWVERKGLEPSFDVASPLWSGHERHYFISRSVKNGSRSDWLMLGRPDDEAPDMSMELWQCSAADTTGTYTIASELLKVHRINCLHPYFLDQFAVIRTRVGRFNTQRFCIQVDSMRKNGIGFVSRFANAPVRLRGWLTASEGASPSMNDVAETLDGLELRGRLEDHHAQAWLEPRLARAEPAMIELCDARDVSESVL